MSHCVSRCRRGENVLTVLLPVDKVMTLPYVYKSKVSGIIFRYDTTDHTRGISIRHLSFYPKEQEFLYHPLTNLKFDSSKVSVFAPPLVVLIPPF